MRPPNAVARQRITAALRQGPMSAPQLAQALDVSPRTALRLIAELGTQGVMAGTAGRRRYAMRRAVRGIAESIPVFTVNRDGKVADAGSLSALAPAGSQFDLAALGWPVDRDAAARDGWWQGLPYPIYDMSPQGFLGRTFARREHQVLEVADDPRRWGDDDILHILARRGSDTSGNFILGEPALREFQGMLTREHPIIAAASVATGYASRAADSISIGVAGSSAAGEFPKFSAMRSLRGSATVHVLVKFSGAERGPAIERWSDLLICEHLALLHAATMRNISAARTRLVQSSGRTFLESERFDRHGESGRSPVVSLAAVNGHLLGLASDDWRAQAKALRERNIIDESTRAAIAHLWWFGRLIANADMHLGNLSFVPANGTLTLAPAYDMLPMAYAPLPGGEVPPHEWRFEMPLPAEQPTWHAAARAAIAFWNEAAADARISRRFQAIARANAQSLETLADKV